LYLLKIIHQIPLESLAICRPHAECIFIKLEDTISGIVLAHEKQMFVCGHLNSASLTIVKVGSDTIRTIDICNLEEFYMGITVSISTDNKTHCGVNIPSYVKGKVRKRKQSQIFYTNEFDQTATTTAFGTIQKN